MLEFCIPAMDIIQELLKLIKINTRISSLNSSDDVLKEIMNEAMSLTSTARAFILEVSPSRDVKCVSQYRSGTVELAVETGWSSSSALEAHDLRRTVYSTHALDSKDASPSIVKGSIQTAISAPISTDESPVLILQLVGQDATRIDSQTLSLLNLLISQAQVTISKAKLEEAALRNAALAATGEFAAQVAHDVRSPLAALDSALKDLDRIPEERRVLIRSAVGRIQDIANNLIEKSRAQSGGSPTTTGASSSDVPQLLSSLLGSLISEKRLQFRSRLDVEIDLRLDESSYGLFAAIPPSEFKRVISNLIDNAVEALPGKGLVTIQLAAGTNANEVRIHDTGKGIPAEVLAHLGRRGETHGKPGGSGLGLHHAKTCVESWGGSLAIDSLPGKGTAVTLRLPPARPPVWFVSRLMIGAETELVVLDDDSSIHQIWRARFESAKAGDRGVRVHHFSTPNELRSYFHDGTPLSALFLLDYELIGCKESGLNLAEELGIGARAILVTSRFEEPKVLAEASRLKVKLIPKPLAGLVPISIHEKTASLRLDAVLIDDDPLTRMTWTNAANASGKSLRAFPSPEAFFRESDGIDRRTPLYFDVKLAGGANGVTESLRAHELGFTEIYLVTGHASDDFADCKHLRAVIGKEPPWGA